MTTASTRCAAVATALGTQLLLGACSSRSDAEPQIPLASFNVFVALADQKYANLRFDNGAVQLDEGGVKGLIMVRQNASTYLAFERNCPYRPSDACSRVRLDPSRLFLADTCCNPQFNLQGQVQGGPSPRPLRQYQTSLAGNILTITN